MSKMNHLLKGVINTTVVMSLSGCVSLLPDPGPTPKFLMITSKIQPSFMHSTKSVAVEEPTCPLMIDGTKIVVERASPSGLVDYTYANENEWAERLPKMIQRAVIEHFKSDYWPGVSAQAASQQSDYRVSIDLRKFQITMPGNVEVSANVTLHNVLEGRAIASQTYNYKVLATPTMSGYMLAFDQATGMLLKDITVMFKNNGVGEIR